MLYFGCFVKMSLCGLKFAAFRTGDVTSTSFKMILGFYSLFVLVLKTAESKWIKILTFKVFWDNSSWRLYTHAWITTICFGIVPQLYFYSNLLSYLCIRGNTCRLIFWGRDNLVAKYFRSLDTGTLSYISFVRSKTRWFALICSS